MRPRDKIVAPVHYKDKCFRESYRVEAIDELRADLNKKLESTTHRQNNHRTELDCCHTGATPSV
jgi:hypothetical protein